MVTEEQFNELANRVMVMQGQILDLNKQVSRLKSKDFESELEAPPAKYEDY
jgi:hypothetical protein